MGLQRCINDWLIIWLHQCYESILMILKQGNISFTEMIKTQTVLECKNQDFLKWSLMKELKLFWIELINGKLNPLCNFIRLRSCVDTVRLSHNNFSRLNNLLEICHHIWGCHLCVCLGDYDLKLSLLIHCGQTTLLSYNVNLPCIRTLYRLSHSDRNRLIIGHSKLYNPSEHHRTNCSPFSLN